MKITVEISPRESHAISKLISFASTFGNATPHGLTVKNQMASMQNKLVSTVKVPDKYLSALASLVEKHDMELRSVISGAMSVGFGVVGLAGTMGKDLANVWGRLKGDVRHDVREVPAGISFAERVELHRQLSAVNGEIEDLEGRIDEAEHSNMCSFEELYLADLKSQLADAKHHKSLIEAKLAA